MPEMKTMFSRREAEAGQERLDGLEHRVVTAAGTPTHLLVGGELLLVCFTSSSPGGDTLGPLRRRGRQTQVGGHGSSFIVRHGSGRRALDVDAFGSATRPPMTSASTAALRGRPRTWL